MATTVYVDDAFEAMSLLLDGRNRGLFSDMEFFKGVAECGPLFRVEVQERSAFGTFHVQLLYQPTDNVKAFLAAIRTRDGNLNDAAEVAADHAKSLVQAVIS